MPALVPGPFHSCPANGCPSRDGDSPGLPSSWYGLVLAVAASETTEWEGMAQQGFFPTCFRVEQINGHNISAQSALRSCRAGYLAGREGPEQLEMAWRVNSSHGHTHTPTPM